ncbi:MAG TPA: hypothetical protein DCZ56_01240 [Sutterella sp.]|nr:hypothetical protein [Sutterella sp.]
MTDMPINKPPAVPSRPDFIRYVLQVTTKEPQPMLAPTENAKTPRGENSGFKPLECMMDV